MSEYAIMERFREDDRLREAYFRFLPRVFSNVNFREWYDRGCWPDRYNPISIVVDNEIVSNVSLARMNLLVDGEQRTALQLGAVGTLPEWRKRGLSRLLMNYAIDRYADTVDLMFLFANDDVVDFYPHFGFGHHREVVFVRDTAIPRSDFRARRLDIRAPSDWQFLVNRIASRSVLTKLFGAVTYDFVTTWHLINLHPNNVYHLEDPDLIAIVSERDGIVRIWDLIFGSRFDPEVLLPRILPPGRIGEVHYYFSPDLVTFRYDRVQAVPDSHLFVRGEFPVAGRHLKFPATAET